MKDKIIIHNYTDLDDYDVLYYVLLVVNNGKISKTKQGEQYCFITTFKTGVYIGCDKRKDTYTFKIFKEEEDNESTTKESIC